MRIKQIIIVPLLAALLSGCGIRVVRRNTSLVPVAPQQADEGDGYKKIEDFDYNLQDVKKTTNQVCLPSVGTSHLLVVPVQFSDGPKWTNYSLEVIRRGYFGKAEETAWQSVSSFYEVSSYGKLKIVGEVAPVLEIPKTIEEAKKYEVDGDPAPDVLSISYFKIDEKYDDLRSKYDVTGDGYIDSVAFVYSNHIETTKDKTYFWAWVFWSDDKPSLEKPVINSYMWISYDFFISSSYAGYGNRIDAHTAIHETGHLLGLDDYYQYDDDVKFDPSGGLEMHAYNIGDENIYSKFALGWVEPYYVNSSNSVTLKLRSSARYPDAIIVNDSWNQNSMDEYLIIEYYTPEGMNEADSHRAYKPNVSTGRSQMFKTNGFRIYHVDSRLVQLGTRGKAEKYADLSGKGSFVVGASNSPSRTYLTNFFEDAKKAIDYKYLHLLESSGRNSFVNGSFANDATLFKDGSSLVASAEFFPNGTKFNNDTEVGYRVNVGQCLDDYGTITISKI